MLAVLLDIPGILWGAGPVPSVKNYVAGWGNYFELFIHCLAS